MLAEIHTLAGSLSLHVLLVNDRCKAGTKLAFVATTGYPGAPAYNDNTLDRRSELLDGLEHAEGALLRRLQLLCTVQSHRLHLTW